MRGVRPPHPALLVFIDTKWTYAITAGKFIIGISEGPGVDVAYLEVQFCDYAMRGSPRLHQTLLVSLNTRYEVDVCGRGGHFCRKYLGGSGGECSLFEVTFCEYAMRGSPRPHPTLLRSPSTIYSFQRRA